MRSGFPSANQEAPIKLEFGSRFGHLNRIHSGLRNFVPGSCY